MDKSTKKNIVYAIVFVAIIFLYNNKSKLNLVSVGGQTIAEFQLQGKCIWTDTLIERSIDGVPVQIVYRAITNDEPFVQFDKSEFQQSKVKVKNIIRTRITSYVSKHNSYDFYIDYDYDPARASNKHKKAGEQIRKEVLGVFKSQELECEIFTLYNISLPANIFLQLRKELNK